MKLGTVYYSAADSQVSDPSSAENSTSSWSLGPEIPVPDELKAKIAAHHAASEHAHLPYKILPAYDTASRGGSVVGNPSSSNGTSLMGTGTGIGAHHASITNSVRGGSCPVESFPGGDISCGSGRLASSGGTAVSHSTTSQNQNISHVPVQSAPNP